MRNVHRSWRDNQPTGRFSDRSSTNGMSKFTRIEHPKGHKHNLNGGKFDGLQTLENLVENGRIKNRRIGSVEVEYVIPRTWELPNGYHIDLMKHNKGNIITKGNWDRIRDSFDNAGIPETVRNALTRIVETSGSDVLVVRSDSFCEDGIHPFAGEFTSEFVVLKGSVEDRVEQLATAFKRVSASLFEPGVQKLISQHGLGSSEQWMSFVVQEVHGKEHEIEVSGRKKKLFFPDMSMVLFSKCLMPWDTKIKRTDPTARIAAGLGTWVVDKDCACRGMSLAIPGTPGPNEVYAVSYMEKGDTGELDAYADNTQGGFHAIDMESGNIVKIDLHDIPKKTVCELFPGVISGFEPIRETIHHGITGYGNHGVLRATFMGDAANNREFYSQAMVDLVELLKKQAGFEVDVELAIRREGNRFIVALVQLRPFGTSTDNQPVKLSNVPKNRIIAESDNCIGHGRYQFNRIGILENKEGESYVVLGRLNDSAPGKYLLIGSEASQYLGTGGAYKRCINPGAVVDVQGSDQKAMDAGTHSFMNVAMQVVIPVQQSELNVSGIKGTVESGVLISDQIVVVEVNGETGKGQVFIDGQ